MKKLVRAKSAPKIIQSKSHKATPGAVISYSARKV